MAASHLPKLFTLCLFLFIALMSSAQAQVDEYSSIQLMSDAVEWPSSMSLYDDEFVGEDGETDGAIDRRSLFWRALRYYYISYGALSANRIPCPPRSGRSYYTHDCYKARGPVHPYNRGCSRITRCRR